MTRLITGAILLSVLALAVYSQQSQLGENKKRVLLTNDRPTVYLTFEREGKRKPIYPGESNQGIWLRLHNNTKWAINFCTLGLYLPPKVAPIDLADGGTVLGLKDGVEVLMCHGVEELRRYEIQVWRKGERKERKAAKRSARQVGYDTGDVFSSAWLPSGSSVLFSVPREHLSNNLAVFVRFNYEWEYDNGTIKNNEPEHRAYFRAYDLPSLK